MMTMMIVAAKIIVIRCAISPDGEENTKKRKKKAKEKEKKITLSPIRHMP